MARALMKECATIVPLADSVSSPHVRGIDSVRALAALSVMFAHLLGPNLPLLLQHTALVGTAAQDLSKYVFTGHPAVIAFFVVSGFCIHYPYTIKPLPALPFWIARLARIMIPVAVAFVFARIAGLKDYNFVDGYILWSIVCELLYYLFYPFFLYSTRWLTWWSLFLLAVVLSYTIVLGIGSDSYGNAHVFGPALNWLVSLPSWLAGCLLAERIRRPWHAASIASSSGSRVSRWLTPASHSQSPNNRESRGAGGGTMKVIGMRLLVALVASGLNWLTINTPAGYYLTMTPFSVVVYYWLTVEISHHKQQDSWLERTGKWSYSIYLMHMPVYIILGRALQPIWNEFTAAFVLPLLLLMCYLFYKTTEQPAHKLARHLFKSLDRR